MKKIYILFFALCFSALSCFAQKEELNFRILDNNLNLQIEVIESTIYNDQISELLDSTLLDSTLNEDYFVHNYPTIFKINNGCYFFNQIRSGNPIKVCNNLDAEDNRTYKKYTFKGAYCNSALIYMTGYESWGYITIDLQDGNSFYTLGKPLAYTCDQVLSYSNYYSEDEISIVNLDTKKHLLFVVDNWTTIETKWSNNCYYLKLKHWDGEKHIFSYLKIKSN